MASEKFDFDKKFQWEILRFTIKDRYGYKALLLYKPEYFDLIEQRVIAKAIQHYFKLKKRIPATSALLIEEVKKVFHSREYIQTLLQKDRDSIKAKISRLYKYPCKDGEDILEKCKLFASYVELKSTLENVDLNNFGNYELFAKKIQKAVNIGIQIDDKSGTFLVSAHRSRFVDRHNRADIVPTPYDQLNRLTNAHGWELGSLITIMDKPKAGKTAFLVNIAKAYAGRRGKSANKKVIYFDFENGENGISTRLDQCVGKLTKKEVLSGIHDAKLAKTYRALARLGGEIYVRRLPALSTTEDCQKILDEIYQEYGIKFNVAIFDYIGLMGSTTGKKDDFERISDAFLDVKNLLKKNSFDIAFTGHHVVRGAYNRRASKYHPEDLAKCIDISRHIDGLFGIQQSPEEKEANLIRLEVLEQRDGLSSGRAIFNYSWATQRLSELSEVDLKEYYKVFADKLEEEAPVRESAKDKEARVKSKRDL